MTPSPEKTQMRAGYQPLPNAVIKSRDACDAVAKEINEKVGGGPGEAVSIPAHIGKKEALQNLVESDRSASGMRERSR